MDKTFKQKLEILPIKTIQHPVGDTKYYAAVHVKSLIAHADEEYQKLFDKYSNLNDSYEKEVIKSSKLESQIIDLKSQLQQQALPVVPEFVGNFLSGKSIFKIANGDVPDDVISWVQGQTYYVDLEKIISHLISLKVTGFTVEKPQLFYLKNTLTHEYLYHMYKASLGEKGYFKGTDGKPLSDCLFTLDEIESMNTGSYEKIEVVE